MTHYPASKDDLDTVKRTQLRQARQLEHQEAQTDTHRVEIGKIKADLAKLKSARDETSAIVPSHWTDFLSTVPGALESSKSTQSALRHLDLPSDIGRFIYYFDWQEPVSQSINVSTELSPSDSSRLAPRQASAAIRHWMKSVLIGSLFAACGVSTIAATILAINGHWPWAIVCLAGAIAAFCVVSVELYSTFTDANAG